MCICWLLRETGFEGGEDEKLLLKRGRAVPRDVGRKGDGKRQVDLRIIVSKQQVNTFSLCESGGRQKRKGAGGRGFE